MLAVSTVLGTESLTAVQVTGHETRVLSGPTRGSEAVASTTFLRHLNFFLLNKAKLTSADVIYYRFGE